MNLHSGADGDHTVPDNKMYFNHSIESYFKEQLRHQRNFQYQSYPDNGLSFSDQDYELGKLNKPFIPDQNPIMISPNLNIINYSLLKYFPKYQAKTLFAWHDVNEESQQMFNMNLLKYFKNTYANMKAQIKLISLTSLNHVNSDKISKLRTDFPHGRIIFHHIGYGFPQITSERLYLSGNVAISPKQLFLSLTPPTLFIFDCNNAGIVLPAFQSISTSRSIHTTQNETNHNQNTIDQNTFFPSQYLFHTTNWSDYLVLCATSIGEELPNDPHFPRDFFTSVLFSPVQTAFLCQIYLAYRTTIDFDAIPKTTFVELENFLDVIVDGIASECIPDNIFKILFHGDKIIHNLFRNFVLAQYLLRPFGVHPFSYPSIPDMSSHQLWEQWKAAVDNSIGLFAPTQSPIREYFDRALTSFNFYYSRKAYSKIQPSLLSTMIRSGNFHGPATLIVDYPSSIEVLSHIIIIPNLFSDLLRIQPTESKFADLCFIIIRIFRFNMDLTSQIPNDFSWNYLLKYLFDNSLGLNTQVLISMILTTCVSNNKSLRQLCTTSDFISKLQKEISSSPPFLLKWYLTLFKRIYDVFSVDPSLFLPTSFHLKCALLVFHCSPDIRAIAISCLACFMQANDPSLNSQLLLYALPAFTDISYLVRHQLLMLILRYLTTHHDEIEDNQPLKLSDYSSFDSMAHGVFGLHLVKIADNQFDSSLIDFFKSIEKETLHENDSSHEFFSPKKINDFLQFLIVYFTYDPHPDIAAEATAARDFFFRARHKHKNLTSELNEEEEDEDDSLMYIPFESDSDALYQINLRHTLEKINGSRDKISSAPFPSDNWSKVPSMSLKVECPLPSTPTSICFDSSSTGLFAAYKTDVLYYDDNLNQVSTIHTSPSLTTDLKCAKWFEESVVIIGKENGCIYLYRGDHKSHDPAACFRADPNTMAASVPVYCSPACNRPHLISVRGMDHAVLWDINTLRVIQDIPPTCYISSTINAPTSTFAHNEMQKPFQRKIQTSFSYSAIVHYDKSHNPPHAIHNSFDEFKMENHHHAPNEYQTFEVEKAGVFSNATSIALHPSNPNLMIVGYQRGIASITDLRGNILVDTLYVTNHENASPIIKVAGNVVGHSTFYACSKSGIGLKWSISNMKTSSCVKLNRRKSHHEIIKDHLPQTPLLDRNNQLSDSKLLNRESSLEEFLDSESGNEADYYEPEHHHICHTIDGLSGVELHDFDVHQMLPIVAYSPENTYQHFILDESRRGIQKVKMDSGSRCAFHPTQPICAFASGKKLKIYRL